MKKLSRLWCWIRGHDTVETYNQDNGRSVMRRHVCLRCGHELDSQYDYVVY